MKALLISLLAVAVIVGLGVFLFQSSNVDPASLPGDLVENQGQEHITEGTTEHPAYNSNPPTSGWHWPRAAAWGAYDYTLADEQLIHNLEHGGIWISYKPGAVDDQTLAQLKDLPKRFRKVVVEPREANDAPIALAAWTRLQKLDQYSESAILTFIEAYYDKGPEKVD